jgi:hypothetical protein
VKEWGLETHAARGGGADIARCVQHFFYLCSAHDKTDHLSSRFGGRSSGGLEAVEHATQQQATGQARPLTCRRRGPSAGAVSGVDVTLPVWRMPERCVVPPVRYDSGQPRLLA